MVTSNEWLIATNLYKKLIINDNSVIEGLKGVSKGPSVGAFFFARESTSKDDIFLGVAGLKHDFFIVNYVLYAIGLEQEKALLGKGSFGRVLCGTRQDGSQVAIKIEDTSKHSLNEIKILKRMGYCLEHGAVGNSYYTIMPLFKGSNLSENDYWQEAASFLKLDLKKLNKIIYQFGELDLSLFDDDCISSIIKILDINLDALNLLKNKKNELEALYKFSRQEKHKLAIACADELSKCFQQGILHRDIKGSNFVGEINHSGNASVKLVDFGAAVMMGGKNSLNYNDCVGTFNYMAPEVSCGLSHDARCQYYKNLKKLRVDFFQPSIFSTASDIFSFAKTCLLDLGLKINDGFGILQLALSQSPDARPSINTIKIALELDLKLQQNIKVTEKINFLTSIINKGDLKSVITNSSFNEIKNILNKDIEDEFKTLHYQYYNKSNHFFRRTAITESMTLSDIINHAQGNTAWYSGARTKSILMRMGVMKSNGELDGALAIIDNLEDKFLEPEQLISYIV